MTDILHSNMHDRNYQKPGKRGDDIQYYEERLSKRKEKEREELKLNEFLHNSLRSSDRLRALEKSKKLNYKMNAGFVPEDVDPVEQFMLDVDIAKLTEALCSGRANKTNISKPDLEWLQRYVKSDTFQATFKMSTSLQEILARYEYPPLTGKSVAQQKLEEVTAALSNAHSHSKESQYKYQMLELLQILSSPDIKAVCYANDECANIAGCVETRWNSENRNEPDIGTNSLPRGTSKTVSQEIRLKPNPKPTSQSSVRIIKSPLPGCYAQIHLSEKYIPMKTVVLEKGKHPLGATVRNEKEAVVIGRIVMGGIAYKSGLLKEGDELLSVNEIELSGRDVNEVSDILSRMSGTLKFIVASTNDGITGTISRPQSGTTIHLKALFSYMPADDTYIPCLDIGLSFKRGEILHVTNVADPNWWQAYRDDDGRDSGSVGGLAGLIPSPDYQYQREMIRKQLNGNDNAMNMYASTRQQSSMLCVKKNKRNQSVAVNGGWVYNIDTNGKSASSEANKRKPNKKKRTTYCPGDLELNDIDPSINTYEEVQMFIPQPHRKRPIVLVGPELIGRHDLVNKIISSDPETFSSVRQCTTCESKSTECLVMNKEEFKHLQNQEEFIETATFEKNWYGISKKEIQEIIDSGKTAVFVLQPESLQIIRKTKFIPYVIFVSPPTNIEQLRKLRVRLENHRPPDDELITTIDRANAIDMIFGQFFDTVIVVNSPENALESALKLIRGLDRDPQWVPSRWLGQRPVSQMSFGQ